MPLAGQPAHTPKYVRVIKTEEKGSDVNMATHLVNDAQKGNFGVAVLVTNDSDLLEAVKIVRNELQLDVGILNPHKKSSRVLLKHASFVKKIRKGVLSASQFPLTLKDKHGEFHKPAVW